jgi:hypothetical protein
MNEGRRVHFDPTINLGHVLTAATFLIAAAGAYATLDSRVSTLERDQRAQKLEQKETLSSTETRLLTKITEQRAHMDQTQVRVADDIREIKTLMRDGFRDLDQKLDRKADKPGR